MSEQVDRKVAAWLALVAEALDNLPKCEPGYGEFYVSRATVSFDGDETGMAIVPDEFGGYAISIGNPNPPTPEASAGVGEGVGP